MGRGARAAAAPWDAEQLELLHWFIRAHLEDQGGRLSTESAQDDHGAAQAAGSA